MDTPHNTKADQHFKEAEGHIKAGRHKEAWKHLGAAQGFASKHAHEMSSDGKFPQAKAYRKMVTSRVADMSRKMNKAEETVHDILKEAKNMVSKGKVEDALQLLKTVADSIKGAIVECPSCGSDAALMKDATQESGECGKCGALWGKKNTHSPLLKYTQVDKHMIDSDKKDKTITKKEVVSTLWEMYRQGDTNIEAYDINYFEATGWLKKSLARKLGLPIPGEESPDELKKESAEAQPDMTVPSISEAGYLNKSEVIDILLEMFKNGEERQRINRHSITKFEATGEIDNDIMNIVYKKAGKNWFDLKKKLESISKKKEEEDGPPKDVEEKIEDKEGKDIWKKKKIAKMKMCKGCGKEMSLCKCGMSKQKGDSDFYDDKKKHDHQRRGALKPILKKKA